MSIIKANNLVLGYQREEPVIVNATFEIKHKDFVFVSGPSGSGKSTLLSSLYGALTPMSGNLSVCDISLSKHNARHINRLRTRIGIVFQDYKLIEEWNVEQNIALPMQINGYKKDAIAAQVEKLLSHIGLLHKANKHPLELSGGEQQRVAMARAIAHRPALILADEPTGNLDDFSSDMIWSLLKSANEQLDMTIVVVTHRVPMRTNISYRHLFIDRERNTIYEQH
ncbi:ABC transporter ATP-binding protein [Helicobacter sp. CLO-3]|uniref:cell division ATP-binding protein FtsE n=1 Tax=unclassified Helicobacter TaxID=2593540 RepID=UPI0008058F8A|nr:MULTISPECIES: ABC transporter ATP-binding protein [unclassified Helicobacter]OBV28888.1 ABC transporter ATP-binding protein [Helicobacter sp. CLO-3]OHU85586.1 ABC transporter ATP-binding protein [Helicobacter sp. CLO-3]